MLISRYGVSINALRTIYLYKYTKPKPFASVSLYAKTDFNEFEYIYHRHHRHHHDYTFIHNIILYKYIGKSKLFWGGWFDKKHKHVYNGDTQSP